MSSARKAKAIDTSDIPPLSASFFERAELRMPRDPIAVTVNLDPDVLAWFRSRGDQWEQCLNAALRLYVDAYRDRE